MDYTKEEKEKFRSDLTLYHQSNIESLKRPGTSIYFYPKIPFLYNGERVIGLFDSELRTANRDVYTELVNYSFTPLEEGRILYRLRYNPHYKTEYMNVGNERYNVKIDELEVVYDENLIKEQKRLKLEEEERIRKASTNINITPRLFSGNDFDMDSLEDGNFSELTIRDLAALLTKKPVSKKQWLNDLVQLN